MAGSGAMRWPLAFSTLGCPGLPLDRVARLARDTGWPGLELRSAPDEPVHVGLSVVDRVRAGAVLRSGGAEPLVVASYLRVADGTVSDEECVAYGLAHAQLAADLGCPFLRVFPGADPASATRASDARAVRRLRAIAAGLPAGVTVLLETHDSHPRGTDVARILGVVDDPRVGAIWDVLHPWRHGEPVVVTAGALRPWLAHVQVKDARSVTELDPVFLGAGAVPLAEVVETLSGLGYAGALSLEWEAKWYPDAPPLVDALRRGHDWLAGVLRRQPPGSG